MTAPDSSCAAACGVPLDAVLIHEGWAMHPSCEFPALTATAQDVTDGIRAIGRRRRRDAADRRQPRRPRQRRQ